jgi:aminopeptidase N
MNVKRLFETFEPKKYKLFLDLSRANERDFSGKVKISGLPKNEQSISLHAKDLTISRVSLDDEELNFEMRQDDELEIFAPEKFTVGEKIKLEIEFSGKITDGMHGLYPCYYTENGERKELFATQFESHHAREVFPCVDEPEAKATFKLKIRAPKKSGSYF